MNHVAKATPLTKPRSAVDYFYSAAKRRSRGALWPIFTPALIVVALYVFIVLFLGTALLAFYLYIHH